MVLKRGRFEEAVKHKAVINISVEPYPMQTLKCNHKRGDKVNDKIISS